MLFSIILKELRNEKGITQADLSKMTNVTQSTIGHWENNRNKPDFDTLVKLSEVFNVSLDYLCGRTSDVSLPTVEYQRSAELAPQERKLLNDFRSVDDEYKVLCTEYVTNIKNRFPKETETKEFL